MEPSLEHAKRRKLDEQSRYDTSNVDPSLDAFWRVLDAVGDSLLVVDSVQACVVRANASFDEFVYPSRQLPTRGESDAHQRLPFLVLQGQEALFWHEVRECKRSQQRRSFVARLANSLSPAGWSMGSVSLTPMGGDVVACVFSDAEDPVTTRRLNRWLSRTISCHVLDVRPDENDAQLVWMSDKLVGETVRALGSDALTRPDGAKVTMSSLGYKPDRIAQRITDILPCIGRPETVHQEMSDMPHPTQDWTRTYRFWNFHAGTSREGSHRVFRLVEDVTEQRRVEAELRTRRNELERTLSTLKTFQNFVEKSTSCMGLLKYAGDDFAVLYLNAAARTRLGVDASVRDGALMSTFADARVLQNFLETARAARAVRPAAHRYEMEMPSQGRLLRMAGVMSFEDDDRVVYLQDDVTTTKSLELQCQRQNDELAKTVAQLQQALEAKSNFMSVMSHEIRTPLNGITSCIGLLGDCPMNEEYADVRDIAKTCSEQLLHVINDVLELAKLEDGKAQLDLTPFCPQRVLEQALDILSMEAKKNELELVTDVESPLPELVVGDMGRLRQILVNLIGNSCKFSKAGDDVVVHCGSRPVSEGRCELRFAVQDFGIGIPDDVKPRLFSPFQRGNELTNRKYGGSGLGLMISKRLAELSGGSVWFESTVGKGSTFFATAVVGLPGEATGSVFAAPEPHRAHAGLGILTPPPPAKTSEHPAPQRRPRVLLLVPSEHLSSCLAGEASRVGFDVDRISTVDALTTAAAGGNFDIVVVDLKLGAAALRAAEQALPYASLVKLGYQRLTDSTDHAFVKKPVRLGSLRKQFLQWAEELEAAGHSVRASLRLASSSPVQESDSPEKTLASSSSSSVPPGLSSSSASVSSSVSGTPPGVVSPRSQRLQLLHPSGRHLRILIAEDNVLNQRVLKKLLDRIGTFDVSVVDDGKKTVDYVLNNDVDIVLLDILMPQLDGPQAARQIRASACHQPHIIAVTANFPEEHQAYRDAGMQAVLCKPLQQRLLVEALVAARDAIAAKLSAPAQAASPPPAAST